MEFSDFINKGDVQMRVQDPILATALIEDSDERYQYIHRQEISEENSKYIIESSYDVLRTLIEAKLAFEGYKSYSHEATILFLRRFEIGSYDIDFLDNLRKLRHGIKYYARKPTIQELRQVLEFMEEMRIKIKSLMECDSSPKMNVYILHP